MVVRTHRSVRPANDENFPKEPLLGLRGSRQPVEEYEMKHTALRFGAIAAAAFVLFALPAQAAVKVLKAGIGVSEQHYEFKAMEAFKAHVEAKSGGNMRVELFPNSMLGSDLEVLDAIKIGTVQMNIPTPSVLGNFVKEFRLAELPFLIPSLDVAYKVADGPWAAKLMTKLEPIGFHGLAIGDFGFRQISNNIRPIKTMKDLQGLKIRVMQNAVILDSFRALGSNPTPMGFGEVFSALQMGTIDGQENPYANTFQSRLYEVQKHISDSSHMYSWGVLVIGKKFYDGLTPDERKIVDDGAVVFKDYMRKASKEDEATALDKMVKAGVTFTPISPEVRKEMQAAVAPVIQKHGAAISAESFAELSAEVKKYSGN